MTNDINRVNYGRPEVACDVVRENDIRSPFLSVLFFTNPPLHHSIRRTIHPISQIYSSYTLFILLLTSFRVRSCPTVSSTQAFQSSAQAIFEEYGVVLKADNDESEEPDYPTHGLPLCDPYPSFSPLQGTSEAWSSYQDQVVPEFSIPDTSPSVQQAQFVPETWIPETPPSAQPEQYMTDYKLPPNILEHMDNSQLSTEPGICFDHTPSLRFRQVQLESGINGFYQMVDKKLKTQVEVIEKIQEMVYELKDKMEDQERKLKAQERKLKGHEYRVGKRYNTRSGKK
jgi:hypothetical protein